MTPDSDFVLTYYVAKFYSHNIQ